MNHALRPLRFATTPSLLALLALLPAYGCFENEDLGGQDATPPLQGPDAGRTSRPGTTHPDSGILSSHRDAENDVAAAVDASDATPAPVITCPGTDGTILATEAPGGIITIALDSANLYWTFGPDFGGDLSRDGGWPANGQVRSVPKTGGAATTIASAEDFPAGIVVAGTSLYWGTWRGPSLAPTPVRWAPISGGTPSDFASPVGAPFGFGELAITADDANLYWAGGAAQLLSEPLGGGGVTDLTGSPGVVAFTAAVDATNIYWLGTDTQALDISGPMGSGAALAVFAAPKTGGTAQVVASYGLDIAPTPYNGIAADATGLYWSDPYGSIMTVPSVGATPVTLAAGSSGTVGWSGGPLAMDATNVYWADENGGPATLRSVPKAGGTTTTIATGETQTQSVAVDESFIYWANGCGQIKKIAK